jgi:hypothetical protein
MVGPTQALRKLQRGRVGSTHARISRIFSEYRGRFLNTASVGLLPITAEKYIADIADIAD